MKPIFRNSMFGFHKEDVFNFITRQNKQYESKISELNAEKDRLAAELEKERETCFRDTEELENLRRKDEEIRYLLQKIGHTIALIRADKVSIMECNDSCSEEIDKMKNEMKELHFRVAEAEAMRGKAEKFDQLSNVLSSILLDQSKDDLPREEVSTVPSLDDSPFCVDTPESFRILTDLLENLSAHCEELSKYAEVQTDNA